MLHWFWAMSLFNEVPVFHLPLNPHLLFCQNLPSLLCILHSIISYNDRTKKATKADVSGGDWEVGEVMVSQALPPETSPSLSYLSKFHLYSDGGGESLSFMS